MDTRERITEYLKNYLLATLKEYYNPAAYKDAGLKDAFDVQEQALQMQATRKHRAEVSAGCIRFLMENGILLEQPQLGKQKAKFDKPCVNGLSERAARSVLKNSTMIRRSLNGVTLLHSN